MLGSALVKISHLLGVDRGVSVLAPSSRVSEVGRAQTLESAMPVMGKYTWLELILSKKLSELEIQILVPCVRCVKSVIQALFCCCCDFFVGLGFCLFVCFLLLFFPTSCLQQNVCNWKYTKTENTQVKNHVLQHLICISQASEWAVKGHDIEFFSKAHQNSLFAVYTLLFSRCSHTLLQRVSFVVFSSLLCVHVVMKALLSGCGNSSDCRTWLTWTVLCSLPCSSGVRTQKCCLWQLVYLKIYSRCFHAEEILALREVCPQFQP